MQFKHKALRAHSKALFTIVSGAVLINPVFAQEQGSEEARGSGRHWLARKLESVDGHEA